jgi:geranylgeranylglycerol-phosphate geranylgeranyltransferase
MSVEVRPAPASVRVVAWLRLWRFHFVPLSLSAGLVGMTAPRAGATTASIVLGLIICVFGYGIGVVINDWFDRKADAVNAPDRPFVSGAVNPHLGLGAVVAMSAALLALSVAVAPALALWSAMAVGGHLLYTWTKGIPLVGNVVNGIDLALFTVLGAAAVRPEAGWPGLTVATVTQTALIAFVLSGFCLVGYFKDIEGDAVAGYRTLPVAIGSNRSSRVALVFPAVAVAAAIVFATAARTSLGGTATAGFWALILLSCAAFATSLVKLVRAPEENAYEALLWYTRATTLFILSLGAANRPWFFLAAAVPMVVYLEITLLATRPSRQA